MRAGIATVAGLDADDGDYDLCIDTELLLGLLQDPFIGLPEGDAAIDPALRQEDLAVLAPLQALFRRPAHQFDDVITALRLAEDAGQLVAVEGVLGDHLVDEGLHLGVGVIAPGIRCGDRLGAGGEGTEQRAQKQAGIETPSQHVVCSSVCGIGVQHVRSVTVYGVSGLT